MLVEFDRDGLEMLVKGSVPNYNEFENPLVKKAGHSYSDQYGRTTWSSLRELSEKELYELYLICRNSWDKDKRNYEITI